jgi:serine/threonine protein kinase
VLQVEALRDGVMGELVDPKGRRLPPCIVMERGESLQEWTHRAEPDMFTALAVCPSLSFAPSLMPSQPCRHSEPCILMLQVLSNVAARLSDMHEAGFVHRDLKPANVMWLPRENRWTVIDFGCTARIGAPAPLAYTLAYAAPEVVRAFELGANSIESNPALDAWSLGVMAFELLTGSSAFRLVTDGRTRVCGLVRMSWLA